MISDEDEFLRAAVAEGGMSVTAGYVPADAGRSVAMERDFPQLIGNLYRVVSEFERMCPGRPFTPDGHMVGSLAECYAEYHYDLKLHPCSHPGHDARAGECQVEIKATQGDRVSLRSGPERLLVFRLFKDGSFEEVYNGPGANVWQLVEGNPGRATASIRSVSPRCGGSWKRYPSSYA
jgi:hypothetical protein